jgi:hypothetical protein
MTTEDLKCLGVQTCPIGERQSIHPLSHKDTLTIFLQAKLVPISEIFRQKELHKNFWARPEL